MIHQIGVSNRYPTMAVIGCDRRIRYSHQPPQRYGPPLQFFQGGHYHRWHGKSGPLFFNLEVNRLRFVDTSPERQRSIGRDNTIDRVLGYLHIGFAFASANDSNTTGLTRGRSAIFLRLAGIEKHLT